MRLFKLYVMQKSHIFQISRQNFLTPVFHQKPGIANDITKLKNKNNPPPPLIHNPFDKAQTLKEHFASISTVGIEPELPENPNTPDFNLNSITIIEQDVNDQLDNLNVNKPGGPDKISQN